MKLFTAQQIRDCDVFTIASEPIASINLMERAAKKCFSYIEDLETDLPHYHIICGMGNNGGDGLAIARMLIEAGEIVSVYILKISDKFSADAEINYQRLLEISTNIFWIKDKNFDFNIYSNEIVLDCIFGTGLNRAVEGFPQEIIKKINEIKAYKIAIDIPSGLFADEISPQKNTVFKADKTLSFQFPKRSFLHPESYPFSGEFEVLPIGLSSQFIKNEITNNFITSEDLIKQYYKPRNPFSHKGTFGKCTLIGGSYGKIGAILMSTQAALNSGVGLVFTAAPKCGYSVLQTVAPEAMFISAGKKRITSFQPDEEITLGIGPGLGTSEKTQKWFLPFLRTLNKPCVLDADALNILSLHKEYITEIPQNSILTPHPKEFERLFGESANSIEQTELAREKAKELKLIIVLKGHHTAILSPNGNCFYNTTGNSGMAKGGSGDVLTGLITGLLAQGYSPEVAARMGVYIHGVAGDIASEIYSPESMSAINIISCLGEVFKDLAR